MNVIKVTTKDYENISNWILGENEPNSNPNKANFKVFIISPVVKNERIEYI